MKRPISWRRTALACLLVMVLAAGCSNQPDTPDDTTNAEREVAAQGRTITIYWDDVVRSAEEVRAWGDEPDLEEILDTKLHTEAAYQMALAAGHSVEDEDVWALIEECRSFCTGDFNDKEDYESFLNNMSMTNDAYWDSKFEHFKKYSIIESHRYELAEGFGFEHGLDPFFHAWEPQDADNCMAYINALIETYLEEDDVVIGLKPQA